MGELHLPARGSPELLGEFRRSATRLDGHGPNIAAAAESAGLTVLHYDSDYDLISEVTGQFAEWVVPRGTL